MDLKTLLFIAGQGRARMTQASKRLPNAPLRPCHNYGGDCWARVCPSSQQARPTQAIYTLPTLARHCLECGIKHLW